MKIFSHKWTVLAHTIDPVCKQFFVPFDAIFRQTENIIRLVDNIYPLMDSNLLSTELYNYAPLIGHDFHFVRLTASHERSLIRSPIEGIECGLRLSDPFVR